ncbi:MAG: hypothetical protein KDH17_20425 [Rhodocyclaceae bacterium]|nr:hypothetical protein [Rhodocyclaceae bacterium]
MGLVLNGWVPFPLADRRVILADRNVVNAITRSQAARSRQEDRWVDSIPKGTEVSPLLHVLEGSKTQQQSFDQVLGELEQAILQLAHARPDLRVTPMTSAHISGLMGLWQDLREAYPRNLPFLREVWFRLSQPMNHRQRLDAENFVLDAASRAGISRSSLVVVAALSCIHSNSQTTNIENRIRRPGWAVLKPRRSFLERYAYNALMDIFHLEILLRAAAMLGEGEAVLYTCDVGLAAFWAALAPSAPRSLNDRELVAQSNDLSALYPALSGREIDGLIARLGCKA